LAIIISVLNWICDLLVRLEGGRLSLVQLISSCINKDIVVAEYIFIKVRIKVFGLFLSFYLFSFLALFYFLSLLRIFVLIRSPQILNRGLCFLNLFRSILPLLLDPSHFVFWMESEGGDVNRRII